MCLDISFKVESREDSLVDYLPHLKIDPQVSLEFVDSSHVQAHDRPLTRIVYTHEDGYPYLTLMRWGIVMEYMVKDLSNFDKYSNNMFNARSERVFDTKSTWYRLRANRCLIDVSGIYEHRKIKGWAKKVPYHIGLANKKRMLIPAFYYYLKLTEDDIKRIKAIDDEQLLKVMSKIVNLETGEITPMYAMVTTGANTKMKDIHNDGPNKFRMPLFFQPEQAIKWIDPALTDDEMKEMLAYELPSEELKECPVDTIRGNKLRADGKEKHEPFSWPGLPDLGNDEPVKNLLF